MKNLNNFDGSADQRLAVRKGGWVGKWGLWFCRSEHRGQEERGDMKRGGHLLVIKRQIISDLLVSSLQEERVNPILAQLEMASLLHLLSRNLV